MDNFSLQKLLSLLNLETDNQFNPIAFYNYKNNYNNHEFIQKIFYKGLHNNFLIIPTLTINLESWPVLKIKKIWSDITHTYIAIGKLKFTGEISITIIHSRVDWNLNMTHFFNLTLEKDLLVNTLLGSFTLQYNFLDKKSFCLSSTILGDYWSTTFSLTPNSFTAELTPKPIEVHYLDYKIEGEIGYELSGAIYTHPNTSTKPHPIDYKNIIPYCDKAFLPATLFLIIKASECIGETALAILVVA